MVTDDALSAYGFTVPEKLIAEQPIYPREKARLLVVNRRTGTLEDATFGDLHQFLPPQSLLVFNNAKVVKARLKLRRKTGAEVECFILDQEITPEQSEFTVMWGNSKRIATNERLLHETNAHCEIEALQLPNDNSPTGVARLFLGEQLVTGKDLFNVLDQLGHMPLPPYIRNPQGNIDQDYQNPFGERSGAVAAPTASLHFDQEILGRLKQQGIDSTSVFLRVGLGTFSPIKAKNFESNELHEEFYAIEPDSPLLKTSEKNWVLVGTTSLRTMESWKRSGKLEATTKIFLHEKNPPTIKPAALITNFHLPDSSLIHLVGSILGKDLTVKAYQHAIAQNYRFYSLGDGMLIIW